ARVVSHNLAIAFGRSTAHPIEADHRFVPHAVFGHPQVAAFGPTRAELEASGTAYVTKTQNFGDVAYGWALEDTSGFLTVHASPVTQQILAAHCIGPMASTVIQPLIQAASFGQKAIDIARGQYWIHPALSEVVENALLGLEFPESD
ncbi:MAG TPA: mycothione reductase, partial [Phycicoccus sp.]|nr:mycothione reductase [Phycicoccus sp.]